MAKKENNQNGIAHSIGEIGTIRDILMGPQIEEISSKIETLQQVIDSLETQLLSKIESLESLSSDSLKELKKDTNSRFEKLEKSLEENVDALKEQMNDDDRSDRERIAKLLLEAGNSLLEE